MKIDALSVLSILLMVAACDPEVQGDAATTMGTSTGSGAGSLSGTPTGAGVLPGTTAPGIGSAQSPDTTMPKSPIVPRVGVTACGSKPLQHLAPSMDFRAPVPVDLTIPLHASFEPDQSDHPRHMWQVDFEPGRYMIVVDAFKGSGDGYDWFAIETVDEEGFTKEYLMDRMLDSQDSFTRSYGEFSVDVPTRQVLGMSSSKYGREYTVMIVPADAWVPSPRFNDCPEVFGLALGGSKEVRVGPDAGEKWFAIDLDVGTYTLDVEITVDQPDVHTRSGYRLYDMVGQEDSADTIMVLEGQVGQAGQVSKHEEPFEVKNPGTHWIRVYDNQNIHRVLVTVRPGSTRFDRN